MAQGALVITPNNRLSNQLLREIMQASPHSVMDYPRCQPYSTFLRDCFTQTRHQTPYVDHPVLLSAHQERALWQKVIHAPCTESLLQHVQDAWIRCQLWSITIESETFDHTTQTHQFQLWSRNFSQALTSLNAIVEAQCARYCIEHPEWTASPNQPTKMIWLSFDDFTPQQLQLQALLEQKGIPQIQEDLEPRSSQNTRLLRANDPLDELNQLAHWLQQQLDAKIPRIAVIAPDLQQQSQLLQRHLLRTIPEHQFDISLGKPITDAPLVMHAIHGLMLDRQSLDNAEVRLLLHSPFFAGSRSEFSARSQFLEDNRFMQENQIPYAQLIIALQPTAPKLAALLDDLSTYPEEASPHEWLVHFKTRLSMLGFPGEYALNSSAYQILQRFYALLDDFQQLALIHPVMLKKHALKALQEMGCATIFQLKKTPSPIQILGLLEASGCEFDAVWIMGLTDQCLPKKVNLTPFIPMTLQREHQMPHSLPERELLLARQLLARLQNACPECVFSYPELNGDTPNLPSPLVRGLPPYTQTLVTSPSNHVLLVPFFEPYHWPLTEHEHFSGGTALLGNQAKCAFRAFALHRLHAKAPLKQSEGLNEAERGQIVHKILERLWTELGSQEGLLTHTENSLNQLIIKAIDETLSPFTMHRAESFSPLLQGIEQRRLHQLIQASLDWEKQRAPFVVKAVEQAFTLTLAGLDFRVRVDRLDLLSDNATWVIDYKSSFPPYKPWNEERPESPQLLLYALLDERINALLFLQLKAGQVTCLGIAEEKTDLVGLTPLKKEETWAEKQTEWHQRLTQLALEFKEGHCEPTPQRTSTCNTCELSNLCRIA